MTYQAAPATELLSTRCAICRRDLLDARSVEAGLGPHCRKTMEGIPEDIRKRANEIVHRCASDDVTAEVLSRSVVELALLGCDKLAKRISERAGAVVFDFSDHAVTVTCRKPRGLLWDTQDIRSRSITRKGRRTVITFPAGMAARVLTSVRRQYGDRVLLNIQGLPETATRSPFAHANDPGVADIFANHDVRFAPVEPEQMELLSWAAKPRRLDTGAWGARIPTELVKDTLPKDGDEVMITTREGKRWPAIIDGTVNKTPYGYVFATRKDS